MKQTIKLLSVALLALGIFLFTKAPAAHAASITVATDTNPSSCSLDEAIENINDQAQTNSDCVETGAYGTNDTITIPSGTITLAADLLTITETVTIQGAGMGQTIIDGDGQWTALFVNVTSAPAVTIQDLTVTAFMRFGIHVHSSGGGNVAIKRVEIDGNGSTTDMPVFAGIALLAEVDSIVEDVYIHDLVADSSAGPSGIMIGADSGHEQEVTVSRTTIKNIDAGNFGGSATAFNLLTGVTGGLTPGMINATIQNSTVDTVASSSGGAVAISILSLVNGGDAGVNVNGENNTFRNIFGVTSLFSSASFKSAAITAAAGALGAGDAAVIHASLSNTLIANSKSDSISSSCTMADITSASGGSGTASLNLTSQGGNLSDDTTCSPYFTHPTDQNNLTNLTSTLSTLSDNGGFVPTIPLLENSPAIDAGVNVPGLTTDARLAVRPQGNAFDSGAYESSFAASAADEVKDELAGTGQDSSALLMVALLTLTAPIALAARRLKYQN